MPQYLTTLQVVTPANTAQASPLATPLVLGDVRLDNIEVRIPPGPSGLVGLAITQAGTQIFPWGPSGTWLVGDDEKVSMDYGGEIDQGVKILTYNLDVFSHTSYLRLTYTPMANVVAAVPVLSPVAIA